MVHVFAYLRMSYRHALFVIATLLMLVPDYATAGTPSYIGPYRYTGYFYWGNTPAGYSGYTTEAEAAQAGVAAAAQANGTNFCNYRMGSIPSRDWNTSGPEVVYVEGVEARSEHQFYTINYSSNMGTWCAGNTIGRRGRLFVLGLFAVQRSVSWWKMREHFSSDYRRAKR